MPSEQRPAVDLSSAAGVVAVQMEQHRPPQDAAHVRYAPCSTISAARIGPSAVRPKPGPSHG